MEATFIIVLIGFVAMGFIKFVGNISISKNTDDLVNSLDPNYSNNNQISGNFKPDRYFITDVWPTWTINTIDGGGNERVLVERKSDGIYSYYFNTENKQGVLLSDKYNDNDWNFQGAVPELSNMNKFTIERVNDIKNKWDWNDYVNKVQGTKYGQLNQLQAWKTTPEALFDLDSKHKNSFNDQVGAIISDGINAFLIVTGLQGNYGTINPENIFTMWVFINGQNMGDATEYAASIYNLNSMGDYVNVVGRTDAVKRGFAIVNNFKIVGSDKPGGDPTISNNASPIITNPNPYYNNMDYHLEKSTIYGNIYVNKDGSYTVESTGLTYDSNGWEYNSQGSGGPDNNNTFKNIQKTISN